MRQNLHVVMSTDSLALPRYWDRATPSDAPDLDFKYFHTFPALLRRKLDRAFPEADVSISTLAKRSSTLKDVVIQAREFVYLMEPSILIMQHGIVDCWLRSENPDTFLCPIEDYERHLQTILATRDQYAPNLHVVIFCILPTIQVMLDKVPRQNQIIAKYNSVLRKQAGPKTHIIDLPRLYRGRAADIVHKDGTHLSRWGHERIASRLARLITKLCPV